MAKRINLESIASQRKKALDNHDFARFAALSDFYGIAPDEAVDFYELGQMDSKYAEAYEQIEEENLLNFENSSLRLNNRNTNRNKKYDDFLREAGNKGVSWGLTNDTRVKIGLLEKYFPRQFSKQDLMSLDSAGVGKVFFRVLGYAKKLKSKRA